MPTYNYIAIKKNGKQIKETLEASSLDNAKNSLRATGYTILEIKEQSLANRDIDLPFLGNPKSKDMAIFCRQFVSIMRAGVPVTTVLNLLGQQTENKKLREAIRFMQADVEKGETLAGAMRKHPRIFPRILTSMVSSGEESGSLEDSFSQMETYFNKANKTKNAVVKAMIYPIILIIVIIAVLVIMNTRIVPRFVQVFEEMNAELPGATKVVIAISNWFTHWWWLLLLVIVALVVGGTLFNTTKKGKHFFGWITLHIPVVKLLSVRSACATFCRTLSLLLASGIGLTDAMELVSGNMRNIYFQEAVLSARTMVAQGLSLNSALRNVGVFPPMVCNMVGIGEESGDLQGMLSKTADYYDDEVEQATQRLMGMMEPVVILFMAVVVIFIVLSIFLPMLNMTKAYDQYLPQ